MKINKYLCIITFLLLYSNSIFGQFEELDIKTLRMVHDEFLIDKDLYSFYPKTTGTGEDFKFWGDTGFGVSNFAILNAGLMHENRLIDALDAWYNKQRELIKDEIEEYYYQKFDEHSNFKDNFKEAVDKTFIDFGKKNHHTFFNFDINVFNLKKNHSNTNKSYNIRNTVNLRELNHLNYRKQEILSGNINNSIFTFSEIFGGIKLKDIRDVNSINTNWNVIKSFLDTNLPTQQNAKYHSEELGNLDSKFDDFMLSLQRKFYDKDLNPGQRLFLEQFSINVLKALRANPNAFNGQVLNLNLPDNLEKGLSVPVGSEAVLQSYLWAYSKKSVFDPNYYLKVLDEILVNNGMQPVYGDVNRISWVIRSAYINIAKGQATERRNNAFNDLMNSSNTEDILTDLAITALGERNNDFLDVRPKLREEVEKYFKANNRSQYSHDGINWLLNQYQDNSVFPVNADLFKSANTPLFQDGSNQNRALKIDFKPQAITEGITNFGNVLAELFKDNAHPPFEGSFYRTMFNINNLKVNSTILDSWLGLGFKLYSNDGNSIQIDFENNNGTILYDSDISTSAYLKSLIEGINNSVSLDDRNNEFLFKNPDVALAYKNFLDMNSSTESKLLLKELEKVFLADSNGYPIGLFGLSGVRLYGYYVNEQARLKEEHPDWSDNKIRKEVLLNMFQTGLDVIGLIPVAGEVADLVNGTIYLVRGDKTNAALSFAATIPIAGWAATGAKLAIKVVAVNGVKIALPFVIRAGKIVGFGGKGAFRKIINAAVDEEAHHIIPWAKGIINEVVLKAANAGFHMNSPINGIALKKYTKIIGEGLHGNHPKYDDFVQFRLNEYLNKFPSATPEEAKFFLETNLIPELLEWINKAKLSDLNLNEYFKQIVNPIFGI